MKLLSIKLSAFGVGVLLLAGPSTAVANSYVLRYERSTPLTPFLTKHRLTLAGRVSNQPVFAVTDSLRRSPSRLFDEMRDDLDDEVRIELDQILRLPVLSLPTRQSSGLSALTSQLRSTTTASWFGHIIPTGLMVQGAVRQATIDQGWRAHGGGTGTVAVVDTGVDLAHPFFERRLVGGTDFLAPGQTGSELNGLTPDVLATVNPTTTPLLLREVAFRNRGMAAGFELSSILSPGYRNIPIALGHGTMVAGAVRVTAPYARIMPIRAFHQDGTGRLFHVISAIYWAQARGASVINLSLNTLTPSPELERAVEHVSGLGVTLVASAGNNGLTHVNSFPASIPRVTGVASVDAMGRRSAFSNAGANVAWVGAPGEALMLPFPGQRWAGGWGTSFAAPLVAGLAAKLRVYKPDATYSDLQSALSNSRPSPDANLGLGLLDVFNSTRSLAP
jgi:subtilisin family serine protease